MKRFALAAVLALGLFALTANRASAAGFGNGPWGISPGSFSIGLGFNVAWSGLSFGNQGYGGGGSPCYGPPAGPQMYDAYGYGGYGHGYGGGYPSYDAYGHGGYGYGYGYGGHYAPSNTAPAGPTGPTMPQGQQGQNNKK